MNLTEILTGAIEPKKMIEIPLFGHNIIITDTIVVMWLIMAVLIVFSLVFTRNMKLIPEGKQNFVEALVELINNMVKDAIGHHWRSFAPYIGTIFLFLMVANTVTVFNIIPSGEDLYRITHIEFFKNLPEFGIKAPTKDINVPAAMAIMSVTLVIGSSIVFKGVKGWFKGLFEPVPLIAPFKILEYGIQPLSLCLRLFGNMLAGFMIMELVYYAVKQFLPTAWAPGILSIYFDLFDGGLQAYVFVFLTSLYISEAIE